MNPALIAILKQFRRQLTALEEELQELQQERGYRVLVEHAADVLMRLRADGTLGYVSPAARDVLGCPPERLVGRRLTEITRAEDRPAVEDALWWAAGGEDMTLHVYLQAPEADETAVPVDLKLGVLGGAVQGMELYAAARVRPSAPEPASEPAPPDRPALSMLDIHCVIDAEGHLREANDRFVDVFGVDPAGQTDEPLATWIHPDDRETVRQALERIATGTAVAPFRSRGRRSDGTYGWFEWTLRPAEDGRVHAIARDLTNQVYAELALEAAHRRYRLMLDHTSDAIITLETDGRVHGLNHRAATLLQRSPTDAVGRPFAEAFPDLADAAFLDALERARDEAAPVAFELYHRPLEIWLSMRIVPHEDGLALYLLDVTERKQARLMLERVTHERHAPKNATDGKPPAAAPLPEPAARTDDDVDRATPGPTPGHPDRLDQEMSQWTSLLPDDPVFDFMLDIMENCLRTARDLLRHLQGQLDHETLGVLESSIHALKSNCQILDVDTLVGLVEQVEDACEAGNAERLGASVRQLVWALEEFQHTVYGYITASTQAADGEDTAGTPEAGEDAPAPPEG
ncbi:hypothetical protein AWN76_010995 [Rhodothermaceae bacterium RA]|nr:hypothetical protein AWN76_010995 [Rhodothermaceae bacterium RA]